MKFKDNNLFDFLNYVLKNGDVEPKEYKPPIFLINRWLSMATPSFAKILNLTTNKWCCNINEFDISKFYRTVFPKYGKRISYIKKNLKEKEIQEDVNMAFIMECSQREIDLFKQTLAELDIHAK